MAPIDFYPIVERPPAYIRKADGLLVPDRKLIKTSYDAMLPGMVPSLGLMAGAASGPPFGVTYIGETWQTADATTYTFTGYPIGGASPNRKVLLAVAGRNGSALRNINTVTLNGNAMTLVCVGRLASGSVTIHQAFYAITEPTGTTATIVVTWTGVVAHTHLACWRAISAGSIVGGDSGATTANVTNRTFSNNANAGSYIICAHMFSTYQAGASWTNATREYLRQETSAEVSSFSGATKLLAATGTYTITVTNGGNFGSASASCIVNP